MSDDKGTFEIDGWAIEETTPPEAAGRGITIDDFVMHLPTHCPIFTPCREPWTAASVDSKLPWVQVFDANGQPKLDDKGKPVRLAPSKWLVQNRGVTQMTWVPGLPLLIYNSLFVAGEWIDRQDVTVLNLYRAPKLVLGDAAKAGRWRDHLYAIYGQEEAAHIEKFLAHRVQHPGEKPNHSIVMGGGQGIGKDTLLEPVRQAVGPWNFIEISPVDLLQQFTWYRKAVVLRISEAKDLGDVDRFKFYDATKTLMAAPPNTFTVNEKHMRHYDVPNVCGVILTTNYRTGGIYLPADDRRHFVAWSSHTKEDFSKEYWDGIWDWYADGGYGHVAAHLMELDLEGFDPKAPPPKTQAFWDVVSSSTPSELGELSDLLELMGSPDAITIAQLADKARAVNSEALEWLTDRKSRRAITHRIEDAGYAMVRNPEAKDGQWKLAGKRVNVYAKAQMSPREQMTAAKALMR